MASSTCFREVPRSHGRSLIAPIYEQIAPFRERPAGEMLVEIIGDAFQFAAVVRTTGLQDAVLHVVVGEHDDRQHALRIERHEIDVAESELLTPRHADHADEMRHRREQFRCAAEQVLRARAWQQLRAQFGDIVLRQRPHLQQ
jgi:hypothetical protein